MSLTSHIESEQTACETRFLLAGHDTVQCAYRLHRVVHSTLDFSCLSIEKSACAKPGSGIVNQRRILTSKQRPNLTRQISRFSFAA